MMSEYEHRMMVRWIVTPPPHPWIGARPRTRVSTEHVPSHDGSAEVGVGLLDDAVAIVDLTARLAVHLPPKSEWEDPLVKPHAADAEWIVDALIRPGDETIERHRDSEAQLRHFSLLAQAHARTTRLKTARRSWRALLGAKRDPRVDPRRPPRGDQARGAGNEREQSNHDREHNRIARRHAEQNRRQDTGRRERQQESDAG